MQLTVPGSLGGERVDKAVALLSGLPRSQVNHLVEGGAVRVDGRAVPSRSRRLVAGEVLEVDVPEREDRSPAADPGVDVPVVHEDEHVIVVDKPAGLVVHPGAGNQTATMVNGLLHRYPDLAGVGDDEIRPGVVHRLDAGTSGLLVVARNPAAFDDLVSQLAARTVERRYRALVHGRVAPPAGVVDGPLGRDPRDPTRHAVAAGGKEARTHYEVLDRRDDTTLLACRLETGRTHQIRVHLAAIGHPVVGDVLYGGRLDLGLTRPYLHAFRLAFRHPATGERVTFDSPVPPDLVEADARR
ncbi:MAG: RluA family pseudouridine synthase [Acidimicrobiales bacterium]